MNLFKSEQSKDKASHRKLFLLVAPQMTTEPELGQARAERGCSASVSHEGGKGLGFIRCFPRNVNGELVQSRWNTNQRA